MFGPFADITYDTSLIDIQSITHVFSTAPTGTINDAAGRVKEAGGNSGSLVEVPGRLPQTVLVLEAIATAPGSLSITTDMAEDALSQVTLLGSDDDHRTRTKYGSARLTIGGAQTAASQATPVQHLSAILATSPSNDWDRSKSPWSEIRGKCQFPPDLFPRAAGIAEERPRIYLSCGDPTDPSDLTDRVPDLCF